MDSTERRAIASPADGLMVYDSTTLTFWYYDSNKWNEIRNGSTKLSGIDLLDSIPPVDLNCSGQLTSISIQGGARAVAASGNFAYVVGTGFGFKVIDISDPANPIEKSTLSVGSAPSAVTISGNYAYVTDAGDLDLKVIDVSDPTEPTKVGSLTYFGTPEAVLSTL